MSLDKLTHFLVGLAIGFAFWQILERYAKDGVEKINPIWFLIMLIWGASGLFFFRKLHIPILDNDFFYMAVPDWDIPLYNWSHVRFIIHRSWLFHSVLLPMGFILISLWGINFSQFRPQRDRQWLRDAAMGLSVGMSAHLIWDALLSYTKQGFVIYGWNQFDSFLWLALNLIVGFGVPFGLVLVTNSHNKINE
jgi:hypothetical protein